MKSELSQIDVVLRDSQHPFRPHGPCLVRVQTRPDSRVTMVGANAVRVAFVSSEIRVLASAMNRAYPRLKSDFRIGGDPNGDYVPGKAGIPFLVALVATDGTVKIGVELTNGVRHPIVELVAKPRSNVRRTGATYSWMPAWTQFRILCAEFSIDPPAVERTRAEFSSMISAKPTP